MARLDTAAVGRDQKPYTSARPLKIFLIVLALLSAVRFVHLDADFPPGITTSRALYTDEGLYSVNAVRLSAGRVWYAPGELNTGINLPVAVALQAGAFRIFGRSLTVARGVIAASAIVLIAAAFVLTLGYAPLLCAGLVAATLSFDFLLFSYSRLATVDVVMTTMATLALLTASRVREKHAALTATAAGVMAGMAALTKTTAVCAIPAVAYLSAAQITSPTRKRNVSAILLASCVLVVIAYNGLAWYAYPVDYVYFHRIAEVRLASGPADLARNFVLAAFNAIRFDPWVTLVALGSTVALLRTSAGFRTNVLVRSSVIWVLGFFAMLSITSYQPSRYFVIVLVPLAMLSGIAIWHIGDLVSTPRSTVALRAAMIVSLLAYNVWHVEHYLRHPRYSFARMAREVGDIVNTPPNPRPGVLLGNMAASVSLESGVKAISLEYGSQDLQSRIAAACPTYFITLEDPGEGVDRALSDYVVEPVKEWNVFDNYYEHRPVRLFRLHPRAGRLAKCSRAGE
jgi:hypothetical protein